MTRVYVIALVTGLAVAKAAWAQAAQAIAEAAPAPTTAAEIREVTTSATGLFDVHVRDVPLPDALRLLSLRAQRNITVTEAVNSRVTADLYQVTLEEALDALLTSGGYAWFPRGRFIYVCRPEEREKLLNANRPTEVRLFELSFIPASDVVPIVTKLLSPDGTITSTAAPQKPTVAPTAEDYNEALNTGLGGKTRAVGEVIVVRDYAEVLSEIAQVVAELDKRPRQVLVEAVILRARLDETNALGIDFNALGGIDFRTVGSTSVGVQNLTVGPVPPQKFEAATGTVATNFTGQVPAGGVTFGLITNDVALFIRALEEIVDLTIVANPKVLTVNEQPGRVIVGRQDGYITTTVTQTAAVQTIEFIETGTQIFFRPFIGSDGYIRMDIHPEDSSGGLTPANLPYKDTTEVTANVMVKDGHTLVIGGLFRDVVTSRKSQIPWLGDIPLFGTLVSGKRDADVREEVIVLITPHIVDPDQSAKLSERLLDDVERWRVLAHRGLMPWGRERLAQAHYQWALEHSRMGRHRRALWDAELALSLNPRFIEANRLREELKNAPIAEADGSVVHDLIRQIVAEELAAPTVSPDIGTEPPPTTPLSQEER